MQNKFKKIALPIIIGIIIILAIIAAFWLKPPSKNHEKKNNGPQTIVINSKALTKTLYFPGTINPLIKTPVTTKTAGAVEKLSFKYGQEVKKGNVLLYVSSSDAYEKYSSDLLAFIKAKQTLNSSEKKMKTTAALYKNGVVSKNEYSSDQQSYYLNRLSYFQAKDQLRKTLSKKDFNKFANLSLSDTDAVIKALEAGEAHHNIAIVAPVDGIALKPGATNDGNDNDNAKTIEVGTQLKKGDLVLKIGNLKGASTEIQVDEININQLRKGQKASITSVAFPNLTLTGYLDRIDSEATSGQNLPVFSVRVIIPKLSEKALKIVKVGMSAKVAIKTQHGKQILIPINTVYQKGNQNMVKIYNPKTKTTKAVVIETGPTTLGSVVVESGLKSGDQVVIPNTIKKHS